MKFPHCGMARWMQSELILSEAQNSVKMSDSCTIKMTDFPWKWKIFCENGWMNAIRSCQAHKFMKMEDFSWKWKIFRENGWMNTIRKSWKWKIFHEYGRFSVKPTGHEWDLSLYYLSDFLWKLLKIWKEAKNSVQFSKKLVPLMFRRN